MRALKVCAKEVRKNCPTDSAEYEQQSCATDTETGTREGRTKMKYVLIVLALAALCAPAFAQDGDNPGVKLFIHLTGDEDPVGLTDNSGVVNEFSPAGYTTIRAYVGVTDLTTGMTVISFKLNDAMAEYPGAMATQAFVNLLPGGLAIGNAFGHDTVPSEDGVTLASTECMPAPFVLVGYGTYFYLGGECTIQILDHGNPEWARWLVDCQDPGVFNPYCVWLNGGIGGAMPPAGDAECEANTPADAESWGNIKALYR